MKEDILKIFIEKMNEYNELVDKYNEDADEYNELVDEYNAFTHEFNVMTRAMQESSRVQNKLQIYFDETDRLGKPLLKMGKDIECYIDDMTSFMKMNKNVITESNLEEYRNVKTSFIDFKNYCNVNNVIVYGMLA
jgi:predicted nuclease with TOPRIM domain